MAACMGDLPGPSPRLLLSKPLPDIGFGLKFIHQVRDRPLELLKHPYHRFRAIESGRYVIVITTVRYFFTRREPQVSRILLVESGSRSLLEGIIPGVRQTWGDEIPVDLVTCYTGLPKGFSAETTTVYRVTEYRGRGGRGKLYRELKRNRYSVMGMICSAEPILAKWKWVLAARIPAKVFVLNENGDYFWIDYGHWGIIRHFALFRAGLTGPDAVRTLSRLALFPFSLLFLLSYAAAAHLGRQFSKVSDR
jgi:hypothetical protein